MCCKRMSSDTRLAVFVREVQERSFPLRIDVSNREVNKQLYEISLCLSFFLLLKLKEVFEDRCMIGVCF